MRIRVQLPALDAPPQPGLTAKVAFPAVRGAAFPRVPVSALVRRGAGPGALAALGADVRFGRLRHDRAGGAVYLDEVPMDLPPRELALVRALLARPGHAVTKERLFEQVFPGEAEVRYEAIEVVAYRLRRKLADTGVELVTLRGLGYLLRDVA